MSRLDEVDLDEVMEENRLRKILVDEGLAHSKPDDLLRHYLGRSKGKCLCSSA